MKIQNDIDSRMVWNTTWIKNFFQIGIRVLSECDKYNENGGFYAENK